MSKRVTHHYIPLGFWKLSITTRGFKTNKSRRAKSYKQLVFSVPLSSKKTSIKEVAVRMEPRVKRKSVALPSPMNPFRRRLGTILPAVLVTGGLIGATYFGGQTFSVKRLEPVATHNATVAVSPHIAKPKTLPRSEPTHITVPSVGIDVDTTPVGLDTDGTIQMPPLFSWLTGWYDKSPTPGELGPSIIVGHVDTYKGISVFWHLREVQPGDSILINRQDGSVAKFKVDSLKEFSQQDFPTQEVYGNINYAGLRLITCGGTFDKSSEHYTENTVVYASLVQ